MPPARARRRAADPHPDDAVLAVHDAGLVEHLRTAGKRWQEAGYADDPGQTGPVLR